MKSLSTIQKLSKIGKILSLIAFIFCLIGAAFCLLGVILLPAMKETVIENGKTLEMILIEKKTNFITALTVCIVGLITCLVGAFMAKYTQLFFKKELEVGTPFRFEIAKKMKKLGLLHIIVSLATIFVLAIVIACIKAGNKELQDIKGLESGGSLWFGVAMLILSVFCKYGAEKEDKANEPKA